MPGVRSSTRLTFFADKAGNDFIGFWLENDAWQFAPGMSPDDIVQIADDALGLRGEEDVEQVANELSADALFALAAAVDAVRLRYLGEWIYRQLPSDQPFTLQNLNDQLRLGLENADPRWSVAMAAAILPVGTFSIATDLAGGMSELAAAGGFVEYADTEKTQWRPGDRLQELAAEWLAPISALMLESVVLDMDSSPIARDCCSLVRGQGPLILLDFGEAVRGVSEKIVMHRVEPEDGYKRLRAAVTIPAPLPEGDRSKTADDKRPAQATAHGENQGDRARSKSVAAVSLEAVAPDNQPVADEQHGVSQAATGRRRFCTQCGTPLRSDAAFCTSCGMAAGPV